MTSMAQPGTAGLGDPIPASLRKSIAVYEAGKALLAYITPEYDEIARVSVCPYNMVTGERSFSNNATNKLTCVRGEECRGGH
jgi:cell division protease FtsH